MKVIIDQCMGCGNCIRWCPNHLLRMSEEINKRGQNYCMNTNIDQCINCGICELMCTAGAIDCGKENSGRSLIIPEIIPPHAGCSFGSITKVLADVIYKMNIQKDIVIFKQKGADIGLDVEYYDYTDQSHYEDGLQYKIDHPEKIVIIVLAISKLANRDITVERLRKLEQANVTIIETLSYFEANDSFDQVINEQCHILEEVREIRKASYIARGSVRSPKEMLEFERMIEKAILNQMQGKNFSVVEMDYPCFFRLGKRPEKLMNAKEINRINEWFDRCVVKNYPTFETEN